MVVEFVALVANMLTLYGAFWIVYYLLDFDQFFDGMFASSQIFNLINYSVSKVMVHRAEMVKKISHNYESEKLAQKIHT